MDYDPVEEDRLAQEIEEQIRISEFVARLVDKDDTHPWRVAEFAQSHDEYVVAMLHDTIEDGLATVDDLKELGCTYQQILAVVALARDKSTETYEEYIDRVLRSGSLLAVCVKLYDLFDHISPHLVHNINKKRVRRYVRAIETLTTALCDQPQEDPSALIRTA